LRLSEVTYTHDHSIHTVCEIAYDDNACQTTGVTQNEDGAELMKFYADVGL